MSAVRIHGTLARRPEARRDLAGCWWLVLEVAPERGSARLAGRQRFGDSAAAAIACRNSAWHLRAGARVLVEATGIDAEAKGCAQLLGIDHVEALAEPERDAMEAVYGGDEGDYDLGLDGRPNRYRA